MNTIKKPSLIQTAFKKVLPTAGKASSSQHKAVLPKTFAAEKKTVGDPKRVYVFEKTKVGASKQQRTDPTIQQQKKASEKIVSSPKTPAKIVQKGAATANSSRFPLSPLFPFSFNQGFGKDYSSVVTNIPKPKISIVRDRWTSIQVSETYQANARHLANKAQVSKVNINNNNNNNNANSNNQIQKPRISIKRNPLGEILVSDTFQANKKVLSSYFFDSNRIKVTPTDSFVNDFSCINDPQLRKRLVQINEGPQKGIKECEARLKLIKETLQSLTGRKEASPKSPAAVDFQYVASPQRPPLFPSSRVSSRVSKK